MPKGQFLEHLVSARAKGGEDGTELKLVRVEVRQVKTHAGVCCAGRGDASVVTAAASSGAARGWRRAGAEQGAGTAGVGAERGCSVGAAE